MLDEAASDYIFTKIFISTFAREFFDRRWFNYSKTCEKIIHKFVSTAFIILCLIISPSQVNASGMMNLKM